VIFWRTEKPIRSSILKFPNPPLNPNTINIKTSQNYSKRKLIKIGSGIARWNDVKIMQKLKKDCREVFEALDKLNNFL
jgi:hypothetical protein